MGYRHFWRVVVQGRGEYMRLCSHRLGGFGFHNLLLLLGAEAELLRDPAYLLARLEAMLYEAE